MPFEHSINRTLRYRATAYVYAGGRVLSRTVADPETWAVLLAGAICLAARACG